MKQREGSTLGFVVVLEHFIGLQYDLLNRSFRAAHAQVFTGWLGAAVNGDSRDAKNALRLGYCHTLDNAGRLFRAPRRLVRPPFRRILQGLLVGLAECSHGDGSAYHQDLRQYSRLDRRSTVVTALSTAYSKVVKLSPQPKGTTGS